MRSKITVCFVLLLSSAALWSQSYELGLGGGGTLFHGDVGAVGLNAQGASGFLPNQPYANVTLRRQFMMTEFNFWPYTTGSKFNQTFYLFAGLGITAYNPQGEWEEDYVDLRTLGTEGQQTDLTNQLYYGTTTLTVPFGLGYRRSIARDWSITTELGWRRYGSDYMDDTSGDFVNALELLDRRNAQAAYFSNPGNVAYVPGLARGNANTRDWSIFAGITIFYNLSPRDERCSAF
jgi:hypothetical protein